MPLSWPPAYQLKRNPRARKVQLKASPKHGLQLVVPRVFSEKHIPKILEENKDWIVKQLQKCEMEKSLRNQDILPQQICMQFLEETWTIIYVASHSKKITVMPRAAFELVLVGNISNEKLCQKNLMTWFKEKAETALVSRLTELSLQTNLHFNKAIIRGQTSRWGSCSSTKTISLNYKLLFLPQNLVDHIILHELCHLKHMNHGVRFWRLLASFDSQWELHRGEMKKVDRLIPAWIE